MNESIEEAIKRAVSNAPPLTPAQRDRLAVIISGGSVGSMTEYAIQAHLEEAAQARLERERVARMASDSMLRCEVCGVTMTAHPNHIGFHSWEPGGPAHLARMLQLVISSASGTGSDGWKRVEV